MSKHSLLLICRVKILTRLQTPNLSSQYYTPLDLLQQSRDPTHGADLVRILKQVQERADMHDVHAGVQGREQRVLSIIKDVGGRQKCALQSGAVAEEVVAEVDEVRADIGAVKVCGGCAVRDEFAEVLAEAASEVEEGGAVLETCYERGVIGGFGNTEVEETECADARVGINFPGTFALEGGV